MALVTDEFYSKNFHDKNNIRVYVIYFVKDESWNRKRTV